VIDRNAKICACGDHGFVKLTKRHTAFFSPVDLPKVCGHLWCVEAKRSRAYAVRGVGPRANRRFVYLHREIAGPLPTEDVDHKNHDGTDNRRENLRCVPRSLNNANQRAKGGKSRFKGVYWHRQIGKWHAHVRRGEIRKSLAVFDCEADAARAYDIAALEMFGNYAATNKSLGLLE
jgi:hypothetical protein